MHDQPRRPNELHSLDCSCCSHQADPARLDVAGIALRFLIGLGWGAILAFCLSIITGVPVT